MCSIYVKYASLGVHSNVIIELQNICYKILIETILNFTKVVDQLLHKYLHIRSTTTLTYSDSVLVLWLYQHQSILATVIKIPYRPPIRYALVYRYTPNCVCVCVCGRVRIGVVTLM